MVRRFEGLWEASWSWRRLSGSLKAKEAFPGGRGEGQPWGQDQCGSAPPPRTPQVDWGWRVRWINKRVHPHNGVLFSHKKEGSSDTGYNLIGLESMVLSDRCRRGHTLCGSICRNCQHRETHRNRQQTMGGRQGLGV